MLSFIHHGPKDLRVDFFKRFMCLDVTGRWPFSVFKFFLEMVRATNINITTLFGHETVLAETYISYKQVFIFFKDLVLKIGANAFL